MLLLLLQPTVQRRLSFACAAAAAGRNNSRADVAKLRADFASAGAAVAASSVQATLLLLQKCEREQLHTFACTGNSRPRRRRRRQHTERERLTYCGRRTRAAARIRRTNTEGRLALCAPAFAPAATVDVAVAAAAAAAAVAASERAMRVALLAPPSLFSISPAAASALLLSLHDHCVRFFSSAPPKENDADWQKLVPQMDASQGSRIHNAGDQRPLAAGLRTSSGWPIAEREK